MIVCICKGASERDVRGAVERGANCLAKLERGGIGGDCYGCENALRDLMIEVARENACTTCCASGEGALATA
jgi:bacterioferritin-associated ferredoxin